MRYTKARRRRWTRYSRRLDELIRRALRPVAIEVRWETWDFLRSADAWAPWLVAADDSIAGGLDVRFVEDLDVGRFRIVEEATA